MSLNIKGTIATYSRQPGSTVTEKNDGTLEGQVVFKGPSANEVIFPGIGSTHPFESRLECYQVDDVWGPNSELTRTASYFGLVSPTTDKVITVSGGQNNDPIETHPDFASFSASNPLDKSTWINGATFDIASKENQDPTGEFLGFLKGGTAAELKFRGTQYYLTPATVVTLSWWSRSAPTLKPRMSIYASIPGLETPPDVADFLLIDTPYRQVGSHYQVTEQYIGSSDPGWNDIIYPA